MYTEEEVEKFNSKFAKAIALGVGLNILGAIQLIFLYGMEIFNDESTIPVAILLALTTVAVPIYVYNGIQKSKYDIELYNKMNSKQLNKSNDKIGKICGVIMLIATIIFFCLGTFRSLWHVAWVVYPIGGLMCGIVSIIFENEN